MSRRQAVDTTRASRDGHEFHENWAARKALKLLFPQGDFVGLAIEGLHPADQKIAASETVEIADVTLYYGKGPTFKDASKIIIVQLKYSISKAQTPFRNSDAKKTIQKFAKAYKDYKKKHKVDTVNKKLEFELVTNRPIYQPLLKAIQTITENKPEMGEIKKQANQFKDACGLKGKDLTDFAARISFSGHAGSLSDNNRNLSTTLADWSGAKDHMSQAYVGNMKQLLRDKAGSKGAGNNLIKLVNVLNVLESNEDELFPCPESFPEVGPIVERKKLPDAIKRISQTNKPFLVHAAGGVGKTIFLQSIAKHFASEHEVILFDCFGGGAYRAPEDARHLPAKAFTHITNMLASKGLCDPLIAKRDDIRVLIKTFRSRLKQASMTLKQVSPYKKLMLFIDAIDNAADFAQERNEDCFAKKLLESIEYSQSIPDVTIVLSCRTERRDLAKGDISCEEYHLNPFSLEETENYLKGRIKDITDAEIKVAYARSDGNPRVLEHLVFSDRGLLDESEIDKNIELDNLLSARIQKALKEAQKRNFRKKDIDSFLAGLSVLPPPVPIEDYAAAQKMEVSEIESFVADLAPLLEKTKQGIWFRDEPTETLVRKEYASNEKALKQASQNLLKQQNISVYAARALPSLLQKIGDGNNLFELAFDERFPKVGVSAIGEQDIRYARLRAATSYASDKKNYNQLVHLLVELSTIEAMNQRGSQYILDNPDLIIASQDVDATRRLFELHTPWQGTRHARLAIAYLLSNEENEAYRHAISAYNWIEHSIQHNDTHDDTHRINKTEFEEIDIVAILLCFLAHGHLKDSITYMKQWQDWYAYGISEYLFSFVEQKQIDSKQLLKNLKNQIGFIVGALSFHKVASDQQKILIKNLAKTCKAKGTVEAGDEFDKLGIRDGLFKSSVLALSMGLKADALSICDVLRVDTLSLWSFGSHFSSNIIFFILRQIISAAANGHKISGQDLLPSEISSLWSISNRELSHKEFEQQLRKKIEEHFEKGKKEKSKKDGKKYLNYETKEKAEWFLREHFTPLVNLSKAFSELLSCPVGKADKSFVNLVKTWTEMRRAREIYNSSEGIFYFLAGELLIFFLWSRDDLSLASIKKFLKELRKGSSVSVNDLIKIVSILSKTPEFNELAGEIAKEANLMIEKDDDVDHRASQYAELSRAILPASSDEATSYFQAGLEQMADIGSGEYTFTNELLLFATSLKRPKIEDKDIHTLTNICELNIGEEPEKFYWGAFAEGLSKIAGCKGLAKLGRWDDRKKVSLKQTLMPYLICLIKDKKIDADIALALLRICDPSATWSYDLSHFAQAIDKNNYPNQKELIREFLIQFEENNSGLSTDSKKVNRLYEIASRILGDDDEMTARLNIHRNKPKEINESSKENMNYGGEDNYKKHKQRDTKNKIIIKKFIDETNPINEMSISKALNDINKTQEFFMFEDSYFEGIRANVNYADRSRYIQIISKLENLQFYKKISELKTCKENWSTSSNSLGATFQEIGIVLLQIHAKELVNYDQIFISDLYEITKLSGDSIIKLSVEAIKLILEKNYNVSASVWISLASVVCEKSNDGEGQESLVRLLNSDITKLSQKAMDGKWKKSMYPSDDVNEIAANLVWLNLGSPLAADRWRAAHSVRRFAKFGRWDVIKVLISKIESDNAHPFQAPELTFYYLYARLWLLISLARVALDYPKEIAAYASVFKEMALNQNFPHVLIQHFSSNIIKTCIENGGFKLSVKDKKKIEAVNTSPHPRLREVIISGGDRFYQGRPNNVPKPQSNFYLDLDFHKNDVSFLGRVFGKCTWEMEDFIIQWVRRFDKKIKGMGENESRTGYFGRQYTQGMESDYYHTYGQQLGRNALFLSAGQLLAKYPVTEDSFDDEPWPYWMGREVLTRNDGLWLSDGTDLAPLDTKINLLEKRKKETVVTDNQDILLGLVGIKPTKKIANEVIVEGRWNSCDDIRIRISSALIDSRQAKKTARSLLRENVLSVWVPTYVEGEGGEYMQGDEKDFEAWLVCPWVEKMKLEEYNTLGNKCVMERPYFKKEITENFALNTDDPFKRKWQDRFGNAVSVAEAWGHTGEHIDADSEGGVRLKCSKSFLKKVLKRKNMDLLIFIKLERYEEKFRYEDSGFTHTTAIVTISQDLQIEYYAGVKNKLHQTTPFP